VKPRRLLRHGRPGLSASRLRIFDLRRGESDTGPASAAATSIADVPPPDEGWMPACPLNDDAVVRRSNLAARVVRTGDALAVVFRNPSFRDRTDARVRKALERGLITL
jgi:hypothetical protein